jgi:valyl-tRNA synthetase
VTQSSGRYSPDEVEPRWIEAWESSGAFRGDPSSGREPYTVAIPPPNVTGALHLGHALNNTIQDTLVRYHRMAGREVEWICGTDHAGIATQAQVEKKLVSEGRSRREMGREAFLDEVWAWKDLHGSNILGQLRRMGFTLDYTRERFTMDDAYAKAVLHVFVDLYDKGHIYRDNYMVNWDPGLGSAISDLELEEREVTDTMVSIAYPLTDGSGELVVATVRPETMLGDTAVAVNPSDERYAGLIGKTCTLPLVGREIPIIADDHVELDFGTGALKVTPAHDPNDFEIGRRHGLEAIGVIGEDGRMTAEAGPGYAGLTPGECKKKILHDLRALGLIREERDYLHTVPFSQRSGERVEPLISLQWFCDMKALAAPAIAAVEDGDVKFTPEHWGGVYLRWMNEIRPWCVSRQLWWGHQLPVWYRGDEVYVGAQAPDGDGWERDPDVLDTWFSSALWPFATLGWPDKTPELKAFYPTQTLSTARDIIFLWVARMVMMGIEYMGEVPFSRVNIHSIIQAPDGRRMSKSLGTGIDPLDIIAEHGADSLRFGMLLMSSQQDVRFSPEKIRQGRALVTKLWNATRLVAEQPGAQVHDGPVRPVTFADRWLVGRLHQAIEQQQLLRDRFDFSQMADGLYHLAFDVFCDWYLELLKVGEATTDVAVAALEQILALAHPVMPFITEECWQQLPGSHGLMLVHKPATTERFAGTNPGPVFEEFAQMAEVVTAIRASRSDRGLSWREPLRVMVERQHDDEWKRAVEKLTNVEFVRELPENHIILPLGRETLRIAADEIDPAAERDRILKEIARIEAELKRAEGMLANEKFTSRAPAELVEVEREKVARFTDELATLREQL